MVWPDRGSNPRSTTLEASTLTITPPMRYRMKRAIKTPYVIIQLNIYIMEVFNGCHCTCIPLIYDLPSIKFIELLQLLNCCYCIFYLFRNTVESYTDMIFNIITLLHRNTRNSSMKYGSFLPGIPHLNYIRMTHRWCNGYRDYLDTVLCNKIKKNRWFNFCVL